MATCIKCSDKRAIGRVGGKPLRGAMSDVCLPCAKELILAGTCPMCQSGFDTVAHVECLAGDGPAIVEPSLSS